MSSYRGRFMNRNIYRKSRLLRVLRTTFRHQGRRSRNLNREVCRRFDEIGSVYYGEFNPLRSAFRIADSNSIWSVGQREVSTIL